MCAVTVFQYPSAGCQIFIRAQLIGIKITVTCATVVLTRHISLAAIGSLTKGSSCCSTLPQSADSSTALTQLVPHIALHRLIFNPNCPSVSITTGLALRQRSMLHAGIDIFHTSCSQLGSQLQLQLQSHRPSPRLGLFTQSRCCN